MPTYNTFLHEPGDPAVVGRPGALISTGAFLGVNIDVPPAISAAITASGQAVPPSATGVALVDTGATLTCVHEPWEFTHTRIRGRGYDTERSESQRKAAFEQVERQRWRALALVIKAKLEAVETGITSFESEFLAHILLPDGSTFGQWAAPELERVYLSGKMPQKLLGLAPPRET